MLSVESLLPLMLTFVERSSGPLIQLTSQYSIPIYVLVPVPFVLTECLFRLLGFYLGRPCRTNMEDVTVGKPNNNANQWAHNKWAPYVFPSSVDAEAGLLDCTEALSQQQVALCELMAPCGYIL